MKSLGGVDSGREQACRPDVLTERQVHDFWREGLGFQRGPNLHPRAAGCGGPTRSCVTVGLLPGRKTTLSAPSETTMRIRRTASEVPMAPTRAC